MARQNYNNNNYRNSNHIHHHDGGECGFCGTACSEQDDFCSPRCERSAQGGKQKAQKKIGWDG